MARHPPYVRPSTLTGVTKAEQAALDAPTVAAARAAKVRACHRGTAEHEMDVRRECKSRLGSMSGPGVGQAADGLTLRSCYGSVR
jgi:hypothetical protein